MERYDNYRKFQKSMGIKTNNPLDRLKNQVERTGYCYNKSLSKEVVDIYSKEMLEYYDVNIAIEACKQIVKQEQYFPSVQTLLSKCKEVNNVKPKKDASENCSRCANTGRVIVEDKKSREGFVYNVAFRCNCSIGEQFQSFKPISDYNGYI